VGRDEYLFSCRTSVVSCSESNEVGVIMPFNSGSESNETSTANGICVLLASGKMESWRSNDIAIVIPRFVPVDLAREASNPEFRVNMAGDVVEEKLNETRFRYRATICRRIRVLEKDMESAKTRFHPAFEALFLSEKALQQFDEDEYVKTLDVARLFLDHPLTSRGTLKGGEEEESKEPISAAALLATHHLLTSRPDLFIKDAIKHRDTLSFRLRSAVDRKALGTVQKSLHDYLSSISSGTDDGGLDPVRAFGEKAKRIIQRREKEAKDLSTEQSGPVGAIQGKGKLDSGLAWSENDLVLIQALRASLGSVRLGMDEGVTTLSMTIAKCCGLSNELLMNEIGQDREPRAHQIITLQQATVTILLQRLGLITPWENINNLNPEFRQMVSEKRPLPPTTALQPTADQDEAIREDFTLPVYVIDESTAQELDDGIAIGSTSHPDQYWLHALIADPTTALRPQDNLAVEAKRRHTSHYHPDGYWPMLPPSFAEPFGLRVSERQKGRPSNAVRFSAKVDIANGKVLDYSVGLASVQNIKVKSYDEVTGILKDALDGNDRGEADLVLMHKLAIQLERRRRDVGGAFTAASSASLVTLEPDSLPSSPIWQVTDTFCPPAPSYTGFPRIHHRITTDADFGVGPKHTFAKGMVAECMILAGRVAGAWAKSCKAPLLYRQQAAPATRAQRQRILALRDDKGLVNYRQLLQSGTDISSGSASVEPQEHFSMGINTEMAIKAPNSEADVLTLGGYARVTSPLRRYSDMVNHWQIKHVLRREAGIGGSSNDQGTPFSAKDLLIDIPRQSRMDTFVRQNQRSSHRYYMHLKLLRGLEARRGRLKLTTEEEEEVNVLLNQVHEAYVSIEELRLNSALQGVIRVQISTLGLPASLKWDARVKHPEIGAPFYVKISDVLNSGHTQSLFVEMV
jgi:hypothetical protein